MGRHIKQAIDPVTSFNREATDRKETNERLFFRFIFTALQRKGLFTYDDVVRDTGLSRPGIAKLLKGQSIPGIETIKKLQPFVDRALIQLTETEKRELEEAAKKSLPEIVLSINIQFPAEKEAIASALINSGLLTNPEIQREIAAATTEIVNNYMKNLQADLKPPPQAPS